MPRRFKSLIPNREEDVKNHPPQRGGIFVERGCCGGAPQRGAISPGPDWTRSFSCTICPERKKHIAPRWGALPLTSPSTNMSPRRGERIFHIFGMLGDWGAYKKLAFCSSTTKPATRRSTAAWSGKRPQRERRSRALPIWSYQPITSSPSRGTDFSCSPS